MEPTRQDRSRLAGACQLSALLLLTACAQVGEYQRPDPPVPIVWPTASDGSGAIDAARTHWRSFFTDERLHALIKTSLEHNRDLRIAAGRVQEARAQYGVVRADQSPLVNLFGSGNLTRTPQDFGTAGTAQTSRRFDVSVSTVSFEIDFWGRLANLSESARSSYLATEEARRAVYLSLVAEVASAYFNLIQLDELTALASTTVALRTQSLALIAKGRDLGGTDDYVFQQASGVLESARADLAALRYQHAVAANRLHFLVGYASTAPVPAGSLDAQGMDIALDPGLPAAVLLMRPDVMAAEQRLLAAHANIGAARAAFLPKILLTAGLGLASRGLLGLFSGGAWNFQPTVSLPIFDGGRTAASLDLAEARKVIAVAEYEKTIQQAFREVADLLSARESLALQQKASVANRGAQTRRLQIAQARFSAGLVSYLEVLDAQRELVAAEQVSMQVRRAQLDATAQLYKALGGGYDNAA